MKIFAIKTFFPAFCLISLLIIGSSCQCEIKANNLLVQAQVDDVNVDMNTDNFDKDDFDKDSSSKDDFDKDIGKDFDSDSKNYDKQFDKQDEYYDFREDKSE